MATGAAIIAPITTTAIAVGGAIAGKVANSISSKITYFKENIVFYL